MRLVVQKISNYGTSTPAVARTALQGADVLAYFACPKEQKDAAIASLGELQRHLVKCTEIRDQLAAEIAAGQAEFAQTPNKPEKVAAIPGIGDLQSRAETFLQSAKLAIAAVGNLFEPFYGVGFNHKFNKVGEWAEKTFGADDEFTKVLNSWEPFVRTIVQLRNCVDHPKTEPGAPLIIRNFGLGKNGDLVEPKWGLTGGDLSPILAHFDTFIEECLRLGENVLIGLFGKHSASPLVVVDTIPPERRDPSNPRRLVVRFRS